MQALQASGALARRHGWARVEPNDWEEVSVQHGHEDVGPKHGHAPHGRVGPFVAGVLGAVTVLLLVRNRTKLKPFLTTALKEFYSFKEWLLHAAEETKEDVEDVAASAAHAYEHDIAQHLEMLEREKAVAQKLADFMKRRGGGAHA